MIRGYIGKLFLVDERFKIAYFLEMILKKAVNWTWDLSYSMLFDFKYVVKKLNIERIFSFGQILK